MVDDGGREFGQPDEIPVDENDPRKADHALLHEFQSSRFEQSDRDSLEGNYLFDEMLKLPTSRRVDLIETAQARIEYATAQPVDYTAANGMTFIRISNILRILVRNLMGQPMKLSTADMERLLLQALEVRAQYGMMYSFPVDHLMEQLEQFADQPEIIARWREHLCQLRQLLSSDFVSNLGNEYHYGSNQAMQRLSELLGTGVEGFLERGDAWADRAIADLEGMDDADRALWLGLFEHAAQSKAGKPTEKWLKTSDSHLKLIGKDAFLARVREWFPLFGKDDGYWFADREERNDAFFKGLIWTCSRLEDTAVIPVLGAALRGAFKARGRAGVRSQKVGNACIWALGRRDESEAAAHLVNARMRIKNGSILKTLERTIEAVATRAQMTSADLEELAVPDFGLENGIIERRFDTAAVRIEIAGAKAVWHWQNDGKTVKAVPAGVKRDFAPELKELKTTVSELEKSIVAQKERLDTLLRAEKTWDYPTWKQRYLQHPLMGLLTHRLIWNFTTGETTIAALPREDGFIGANGEALTISEDSRVSLYHPLFDTPENVLQWRSYFENHNIKQPFKQAHREIYLLTDAERTTETYSNRFASHVLKQHQFNSLCAARGWKNQLRLMVDDSYPPATKIWPNHNLRAEFWIEGIGDDYGTDTNEAGSYLRLSTDQVRFYPLDAPENHAHAGGGGYSAGWRQQPTTPLPLEQVPPLVFSETMRDVDLFVGVASLGADPNWSDGGPNGHFRNYWSTYAWGELGESAKSRADVLSRLLPRLKIKDKVALEGRFLRVEGKKRTYKIHLGSGNILMEPNAQYLCIVPSRGDSDDVFLPFEGDRTLALILSKAFLLFDDDKIKDTTITRQIEA